MVISHIRSVAVGPTVERLAGCPVCQPGSGLAAALRGTAAMSYALLRSNDIAGRMQLWPEARFAAATRPLPMQQSPNPTIDLHAPPWVLRISVSPHEKGRAVMRADIGRPSLSAWDLNLNETGYCPVSLEKPRFAAAA